MREKQAEDYCWLVGPEPAAQVAHPEKEMALVDGEMVPAEEALTEIALKVIQAKKPVLVVPARIILFSWEEDAPAKARALRELAEAMGAEIRPIFDVRPQYPIARTAVEINPFHGDLVIAHENYDVVVFYGVECLYADVALKIISQGTKCYTIALCGKIGHVDASITLRDTGIERVKKLTEIIRTMRQGD
ncbi:carbon monoxide dehydrogenase beta subunit family protein [Desulfitibacter alkalitolerans]|uniref:carbon monoxide dehydrogenase beta subunit family protein n=1 Tax=Desulfitibacter alkalitolerans TaxID=264641 RepID=UPI00047F681F|nr:carbon monoxide dehydrogenase beta subunit family protein [Desulfitibacter alkalitolerans]